MPSGYGFEDEWEDEDVNAIPIPTIPIKHPNKRDIIYDVLTMIYVVVILLLCCAGIFILVIKLKTYENPEDKKWNHGVCAECNTPWHYKESVGHQHNTTYIYECECGEHHIEMNKLH